MSNSYSHSPYVTYSLMRRWVCLLWICLTFCQLYVSHLQHVVENSSFCSIIKSSVSIGFAEQFMLILLILCYNGSLVTWTVVSLSTAKFKPLIFCQASPCPIPRTCSFSWFCAYYSSQSQSYFTTGGLPPISSTWRQAPWDPRPDFFFDWTPAVIVLM
jgi:hypothetical protein